MLVCVLGGCAGPAGELFSPAVDAPRWPPPPDAARIRYVGEFRTDADLKPARRPGRALGELLLGKADVAVMLSPIAVCTDGESRVFVADSNAQAVHVFDLASRRYERWKPPEKQTPLSQPVSVCFEGAGAAGRLLVADSVGGVVVEFDGAGRYVGRVGDGVFSRPCGIAVTAGGRVLVADTGAHQVVVLSADGREEGRIGRRGAAPGEFNYPTYVALDGGGRLYVSDSLNSRVQVFEPGAAGEFEYVRQIGRKGDVPGTFSQPKGIAMDCDGHLYVVDAHFEAVQVFDGDGTLLTTFGREGGGAGEFWLPGGIAIDAANRIWVADSYNRRVQVFEYLPEREAP